MKKRLTLALAIVGLGGLFQAGCFGEEIRRSEVSSERKYQEQASDPKLVIRTEIAREEMGAEAVVNWRESPGLAEEYKKLFTKYFVTNGGEEAERSRQLAIAEAMKASGNWNRISSALELMVSSGMATSEFSTKTFSGIGVGEYHPASNLFGRQIDRYRDWESNREGVGYKFPISRLNDYPLNFPPEMFFAALSGDPKRNEWKPSLLIQAAEIRDRSVSSYSKLMGERSIMLGSAYAALNDLRVEIPLGERHKALAELSPYFVELERKIEEVKLQYANSLGTLYSSFGD